MSTKHWKRYVRAAGAIDRRVRERVGESCVVNHSAFEMDADDLPIDNLDAVAFRGKIRLVAYRDEFFGGASSRDWESPVLEDPTWLDLCVQANAMILATNDRHHRFLEGIDVIGRDGEVTVAELSMGS
jgi:hypothetical protein